MPLAQDLYELYLVDKQLRGMRSRLDSSDKRLAAQTTRLTQFTCQRDELTAQINVAKAKAADLEGQSKSTEQRCDTLRERMNSVTNNKEYSALLVEVNTLKLETEKFDEAALEELSRIDMLEQQQAEVNERITDQQKLVDVAHSELKTRQGEIGNQVDNLTQDREAAAAKIPVGTMATFNRLAEHDDDDPLAVVIEEDRRNMAYICGGCYMNLPVEHVNTLLVRPDEVVCCTTCSRILYIDQELKAAMGVKA